MKKVVLLFSAVVLCASLSFAQTQDKTAKPATAPAKTETTQKSTKAGCDDKTKAACTHSKDGKGCCSHDKKEGCDHKTPDKK